MEDLTSFTEMQFKVLHLKNAYGNTCVYLRGEVEKTAKNRNLNFGAK